VLSRMKGNLLKAITGLMICTPLALGAGGAKADTNIAGKKVIFVPISMGISLTEAWARRMKEHAAIYGSASMCATRPSTLERCRSC
jgi:ribose transport system substrate-binding protein